MTEKELRTLDEMLTNLEIWSTWNKTFANEMIGVCSKMRNLMADRKTESSSEIPNNCEHITEDGVTCAKYPACDDCLDNPLNKVKGSERLVKGSERIEPTISKMEQVDKDINVRSKDEPQLTPNYCGTCKHREVPCGDLPCDVCHGYSNYEPKDEPQTERSE